MTEDELRAIEKRCYHAGKVHVWNADDAADDSVIDTWTADTATLIVEVRRLRKLYETPATSANLPPDFIAPLPSPSESAP